MNRAQQPRAKVSHFLFLCAFLAAIPGPVFAQRASVTLPENARAVGYGLGWECKQGYRSLSGACTAVKNRHMPIGRTDPTAVAGNVAGAIGKAGATAMQKRPVSPSRCRRTPI